MTIETLKSPNPRNRKSISVIKSKFLSVSSMNTMLAILKVTDARRDVILVGALISQISRHTGRRTDSTDFLGDPFPPPPCSSLLTGARIFFLNIAFSISLTVKEKNDHRSKFSDLSNWKEEA